MVSHDHDQCKPDWEAGNSRNQVVWLDTKDAGSLVGCRGGGSLGAEGPAYIPLSVLGSRLCRYWRDGALH